MTFCYALQCTHCKQAPDIKKSRKNMQYICTKIIFALRFLHEKSSRVRNCRSFGKCQKEQWSLKRIIS